MTEAEGSPGAALVPVEEPGPPGDRHPRAPVIDSILLGRSGLSLSLSMVLLVGLGLLVAGLEVVRADPDWTFTYDGAVSGILSQLGTTLPAGILVGLATAANVLVGAITLRLAGMPPFRRLSDLILGGFAAAVVIDSAALFLLGWIGLFRLPVLLALHALAIGWFYARRPWPLMSTPVRVSLRRPLAWWPLVLAIWAGPLIVQLASPAVPFMDVLPNHVAPVEHVRIFGSFATLTTSPSPIYGPSRLMLGYVALLGQITTITNLDAVLAEAAFGVPLAILLAIALRRLAGALFGGSASFWILLTFPLTFTFMRIPDARGTVVVFPLAAWALAVVADELRLRAAKARSDDGAEATTAGEPPAFPNTSAILARPDLALAFALGGAFLVHPLVGLVGIVAVVGALILYPVGLARRVVPALVAAAFICVPQALTMGGIGLGSIFGFGCVVVGVAVAFGLAPVVEAVLDRVDRVRRLPSLAIEWRWLIVLAGIAILLVAARMSINPPDDPATELPTDFRLIVLLTLLGAILALFRPGRGWVLLGCGIGAGVAAWAASGFVGNNGLTEQAVHYEVPKSVEYWLPVMLALGSAGTLAAIMRIGSLGWFRTVFVAFIAVITVFPIVSPIVIGPVAIDGPPVVSPIGQDMNIKIGEHRAAESVGLALREAEQGYWTFYPDSRLIINEPRREVVDELLSEIDAGRLGPNSRVLNIASSFQQWSSVPVGVFTGAIETSISLQPELSIHTEGGRLLGFDALDGELADGGYAYVVLEPAGLSDDLVTSTQAKLAAAGFDQIWSNSQAIVYRAG